MTATKPRTALRNGALLTGAIALTWVAVAAVAWAVSGPAGVARATISAVLCLTPGWLVFAFAGLYGTAAPLGMVVFGLIARVVVVLAGAVTIKLARPDLAGIAFAVCLGVFYVVALAIETTLLLTPPTRGNTSAD